MKLTDRIAQLEHDHTPPVPMGVIVVPHRSDRDACIAGELAKMPRRLGTTGVIVIPAKGSVQ